jgi:hypothetical protein
MRLDRSVRRGAPTPPADDDALIDPAAFRVNAIYTRKRVHETGTLTCLALRTVW